MGWFDAIFKAVTKKTRWAGMLNGSTPIFSQFGRNIYASDVVQQAVKCIVDEMKKLTPCHVRMNREDPVPVNDSVQKILDNPNPIMSKSAFLEKITWTLLLNYNAFVIPVYDSWMDENGNERRNYRAMYPVSPETVTFLEDPEGNIHIKMDFANRYTTTLPYRDVIHLRYNYSVNEFMGGNEQGLPDHSALLETLQTNKDMLKGIGAAMKGSYSVNAAVKFNTFLDDGSTIAALKELEEKLRNNESGFLPLDLKSDFIPIKKDVKLVDSDTLKFIDEKILRNWGVPLPILTGDYTKPQYEAFYQKTLEPLITDWSDEFARVLFTERQKSYHNRVIFYPKKLIFMSTEQTLEMVRLLGDSGSIYENEKRAAFGMMPLPELEGKRMQSLNYVNTEFAGRYQVGRTDAGGEGTNDQVLTDVVDEAVKQTEDIVNKPLLVGQIQALGDIIKGFQAGSYTYSQAKNMLMIGVGLTEGQAKKLLDKQEDITGGDSEDA